MAVGHSDLEQIPSSTTYCLTGSAFKTERNLASWFSSTTANPRQVISTNRERLEYPVALDVFAKHLHPWTAHCAQPLS